MSRTGRIAAGVRLSLLNQVVGLLVGLWLTRFLLDSLGATAYGTWLVALQVAAYLGLADVGVMALLPRETAFAIGRATPNPGVTDERGAGAVAGVASRIVLWQWPAVCIAAVAAWWIAAARWPAAQGILPAVLALTAIFFPFRLFAAVLTGMQDFSYLGWTQLASWASGVAVTVGAILAGWGTWALVAGWGIALAAGIVAQAERVRRRCPGALRIGPPGHGRAYLGRSAWIGLSQVAGLLTGGTELLVIGAILGPQAVVAYACTTKLVSIAANLPQAVVQTAAPALSELRMSASATRLQEVSTALTQAVMVASGLVAVVVLLVNRGFVAWWVGPAQFGGGALSVLVVILMVVRHYGTTLVFSAYSFGHERATALIGIAQSAVGLAAMVLLVPRIGLAGAPAGFLAGECLVTLPFCLRLVAGDTGAKAPAQLRALAPWLARAAIAAGGAAALGAAWRPSTLPSLAVASGVAAALYLVLARDLLRRQPLASYARQAAAGLPRALTRPLLGDASA